MFHEWKEVKYFKEITDLKNVIMQLKYFEEIKRLKKLQKAEVVLEPKRASLYIGLRKYWNFQNEAKEKHIIATVTARRVSCLFLC